MYDEVNLYNALSEWAKEKDPTPIGGRPTFLVICATENDGRVGILAGHVDPLMPKKMPNPPLDQTVAQNTLVLFKERGNKLLKECIGDAARLDELVEVLGKEVVCTLMKASSSGEDFAKRIKATGKL